MLPILVEPKGLSRGELDIQASTAAFNGKFVRDLKGSDPLHWGEGQVYVGAHSVTLDGQLAPGPDYKLYLSPVFVETAADFERNKPSMVRLGDVRAFHNFHMPVPADIDPSHFSTVVVWCETFHQFISAAKYR
jgi:Electron transfer DM13